MRRNPHWRTSETLTAFHVRRLPMKKGLIEIIGWYGTVAIVGAYALSSFGFLSVIDPMYQLLNATGAVGIVVVSFSKRAWQPGVLNLVWLVVAIIALVRILIGS